MFGAVRVGGMIGVAALGGAAALALLAPHQPAGVHAGGAALPKYYGVNLPSGSFGKRHPGEVYGSDYIYPTAAVAEPFSAMGMNSIRLAFIWGRLQHNAFDPLDADELQHLDRAVDDLGGFQQIILDVHNYGRYKGDKIDNPATGGAELADLWTKIADHYKDNPRVAFGIMNEPHGIDARTWRAVSDEVVAAIRKTGARNLILVPGTNWSGAHNWNGGGDGSNAAAMSGFRDPGRNFVFELHQYLDSDSSGTKPDCVDATVGRRRLAGVTQWLRQQHAKGFLAEFGVPPTPVCLQALDDMLNFVDENGDVWAGWTYWAAGARWRNYPFSIQPKNGETKPQAEVLARHIARYHQSALR
jgi:endoglucanase